MGVAAYRRGTELVRRQVAEDFDALPKRHPAEVSLYHAERVNENLRKRVESLEADLEKAKKYLKLARTERKIALDERNEYRQRWKSAAKAAAATSRRWIKASNLLRMLPADLVREARETGEHQG